MAGVDPAIYGIGYEYGVRLKNFPALGSAFGPFLMYDDDLEHTFIAPLFSLRLVSQWRLAPYVGLGGSYWLSVSGTDSPDLIDGDTRADSHWAAHAEAGLRWRTGAGGYVDLGGMLLYPFVDTPDDVTAESFIVRLAFGFEP